MRKAALWGIGIFLGLVFLASLNDDPARPAAQPAANAEADALRFCIAFERTELVGRCNVDTKSKSVSVTIHTDEAEARKMCAQSAAQLAQYSRALGGWTLQFYGLGGAPLATCRLG